MSLDHQAVYQKSDDESIADFSNAFLTTALGPETCGSVNTHEKIDISETSPGPMYVYVTAKTAAEKKVWEIADQHPEVDVTTSKFDTTS